MIDESVLTFEEKTSILLRSLYKNNGYQAYKMNKFEEYDLYAKNKDFLLSENIITFTDMHGKLLALKPDVTLSIVRNGRDEEGKIQKVYYNENVYRTDAGNSYKEIMQVGLECIGAIDNECVSEMLRLAAESLKLISPKAVLIVSDLDILSAALDMLEVDYTRRSDLMKCISEKNMHGLSDIASADGMNKDALAQLQKLASLYGNPGDVLSEIDSMPFLSSHTGNLHSLMADLERFGCSDIVKLDFSVTGDLRYYNGIVFRGYISGVPESVITGGRYDRLMKKMHRSSDAIGFAVSLSALEGMARQNERSLTV